MPADMLSSFLNWLRRVFGRRANLPPQVSDEPAQVTQSRVLLIIYDPVVDAASGRTLSAFMGWRNPDLLVTEFIGDINETSRGLAQYQIVDRITLDAFPRKADGFCYTPQTYLNVLRRIEPPHVPERVDYDEILQRFDILRRVAAGQIDEVWVFAFPHAGFYESTMGGVGAFWCNAPPLEGTASCPRCFIVMGFSYERGVGEMLESFGHRAESLLQKTFARTRGADNLYEKFIRYDKIAPGRAEVGNIHFAPNSEFDYDWGNPRPVTSYCDDWYNFPNFTGLARQVSARDWGGGEIRAHHKWWLDHLPRANGRSNGIAHNWWQYILDPNRVLS